MRLRASQLRGLPFSLVMSPGAVKGLITRENGRSIGEDVLLDPPLLVKISCGPTSVLDGGMLSAMYPTA